MYLLSIIRFLQKVSVDSHHGHGKQHELIFAIYSAFFIQNHAGWLNYVLFIIYSSGYTCLIKSYFEQYFLKVNGRIFIWMFQPLCYWEINIWCILQSFLFLNVSRHQSRHDEFVQRIIWTELRCLRESIHRFLRHHIRGIHIVRHRLLEVKFTLLSQLALISIHTFENTLVNDFEPSEHPFIWRIQFLIFNEILRIFDKTWIKERIRLDDFHAYLR